MPYGISSSTLRGTALLAALICLISIPAIAQSPWELAADRMRDASHAIARSLSVVAIVIGGLTLAFGESHQQKWAIASLIFGIEMALGASAVLGWITGN